MSSNEEVLCRIFWSEEGQDSLDALMDYDTPSDILEAVDDFVSELREVLGPAINAAQSRVGANVRLKDDEALLEAGGLLGVIP